MSYIILRGRWCDIIVTKVHAQTGDKINDIKDRFYEELEHVFDKFPKIEKPPFVQPLKNFPAYYGTRRFITVFTIALHQSLS
jgi:hypothetical protein